MFMARVTDNAFNPLALLKSTIRKLITQKSGLGCWSEILLGGRQFT